MRSGARKLRTKFSAAALTHFGGVYLLHQFLQRLHLRWYLQQHIEFSQRNHRYTLSEMLLALMYPMILGLEKIEVSALLRTNGVFQYITGLPSFPNPQTFRRFLVRAAPEILPQLKDVHDRLRACFLQLPTTPSSFWIDCDSTACTLYGKKQEGVVKGYNPNHPGRKSYHPLIITEGHRGDCLAGMLRKGNAHTADGIDDLLKRVRHLLPHRSNLRLRADCGFYSGEFIANIRQDMQYAVVAKMTNPIKNAVEGRKYKQVNQKFSTASFQYKPHGWDRREKFAILRRRLPQEEEEQATLFTLDAYAYSVIVSNLPLTPYGTFEFYGDRMGMERIIRMLKDDYPFGSAPTADFQANALYAELSMLAYNLITWFKRLCLPDEWQSFTLPTIRHRLLMVPGEFVKSQNIPTLRMPRNCLYQDVFLEAQEHIKAIDPLI